MNDETMATVAALNSLSKSIGDYKAAEEAGELGLQATRETNEANLQIARETNQANVDLYNMQAADALKLQRDTQSYNSAQEQVRRLREAGLNPALSFGDSTSVGSVSLPSASPAVGATMQTAPYEAYSDLSRRPVIDLASDLIQSMSGFEKLKSEQIDNNTKSAYNRVQIDEMLARIDNLIESGKTTSKQRSVLEEQRKSLKLANRLFSDTYNDKLMQSDLQSKFMQLQNRSIDEGLANDAARLAIQRYEAQTHRMMTNAQVSQIQVLSNLAVSADWRAGQSHVLDMNLKAMDGVLKRLNISDTEKQNVFNEIMRQSEATHTKLKDLSIINQAAEVAFGLGLRDVGTALRNFIGK